MESATGGFRSLRNRVKAAKESSLKSGLSTDTCERLESSRTFPEDTQLGKGVKEVQRNQEHLSEQEKYLNALYTVIMKEQQNLQSRERSIRSIEHSLNEEMERVANKERSLDAQILEITRLEERLHDALQQQEHKPHTEPQHAEANISCNDHTDREIILDLREKELVLSRARVDDKLMHLHAKERVLNEKEAELASFQAQLESKAKGDDERIKNLEQGLTTSYTQMLANVEVERQELEAWRLQLAEREEAIAYREHAAATQAEELAQFQQLVSQQHELNLMEQEEHLTRCWYLRENVSAVPESGPKLPQSNHSGRVSGDIEQQPQRLKRKGTLGRFFK